ncbi:MAG: hypothetical protein JWO45_2116 [Spartobacteria bacterium]|nr:hypothetical protein [Spartobacteria bacterium]
MRIGLLQKLQELLEAIVTLERADKKCSRPLASIWRNVQVERRPFERILTPLHLFWARCNCLMAGKKIIFVTGSSGLIGSEVCLVNRRGDHICYPTGLRKRRAPYPKWDITESLEQKFGRIVSL